jgi:hypothetical protein
MNKLKQDMESWAKSMNKKKEIKKQTVSQPIASITNPTQSSGFVEIKPQGFAPIEKKEDPIEQERPLKDADDTSLSTSNFKVLARIRIRHVKIKLINMFLKLFLL